MQSVTHAGRERSQGVPGADSVPLTSGSRRRGRPSQHHPRRDNRQQTQTQAPGKQGGTSWSAARSGLLDVPQEAIDLLAVYQEAAVALF